MGKILATEKMEDGENIPQLRNKKKKEIVKGIKLVVNMGKNVYNYRITSFVA